MQPPTRLSDVIALASFVIIFVFLSLSSSIFEHLPYPLSTVRDVVGTLLLLAIYSIILCTPLLLCINVWLEHSEPAAGQCN